MTESRYVYRTQVSDKRVLRIRVRGAWTCASHGSVHAHAQPRNRWPRRVRGKCHFADKIPRPPNKAVRGVRSDAGFNVCANVHGAPCKSQRQIRGRRERVGEVALARALNIIDGVMA